MPSFKILVAKDVKTKLSCDAFFTFQKLKNVEDVKTKLSSDAFLQNLIVKGMKKKLSFDSFLFPSHSKS